MCKYNVLVVVIILKQNCNYIALHRNCNAINSNTMVSV